MRLIGGDVLDYPLIVRSLFLNVILIKKILMIQTS
jgi:hypothetical protein